MLFVTPEKTIYNFSEPNYRCEHSLVSLNLPVITILTMADHLEQFYITLGRMQLPSKIPALTPEISCSQMGNKTSNSL